MDASKVTVSPEYLRFTPLTRYKRADLRRKNIIDLIRSKPSGTPISLAEFSAVCDFKGTSAAHAILGRMVKAGTIVRQQEGINRYSYYVAADAVNTQTPATTADPMPEPITKHISEKPTDSTIADLAKEFYWNYNSDNLHEFIKWLGEK